MYRIRFDDLRTRHRLRDGEFQRVAKQRMVVRDEDGALHCASDTPRLWLRSQFRCHTPMLTLEGSRSKTHIRCASMQSEISADAVVIRAKFADAFKPSS